MVSVPNPEPLRRRYVMVVEDDQAIRDLFSAALRKSGAEVVEATDGIAALKLICTRMPDVVVTDITMPRLDGIEFIRRLRRNPRADNVPIIVISGYAGTGTIAEEARQAGCDAVLAKPCSLQTLLSVVVSKSVDRRSGQPALS